MVMEVVIGTAASFLWAASVVIAYRMGEHSGHFKATMETIDEIRRTLDKCADEMAEAIESEVVRARKARSESKGESHND